MNLVYCEWRKLFYLPALWAFLGLCLVFNGLLIATQSPYDRAFFNDTSADAELLGQRVDGEFLAGLSAMPETENCCSSRSPAWRMFSRPMTLGSLQTSTPAWSKPLLWPWNG